MTTGVRAAAEAWVGGLRDGDACDRLAFLPLKGIDPAAVPSLALAPAFLQLACAGSARVEQRRFDEIGSRMPDFDRRHRTGRSIDAAYALRSGAKLVLCPFKGRWRHARRTIAHEAYWHVAGERVCIVLQFCNGMKAVPDTAYLFPHEGVVLYFDELLSRDHLQVRLARLFRAVARNAAAVVDHVTRGGGRSPCAVVEFKTPHFGHYVGNALTGLGQLLPELADRIDLVVTWEENNFVAPANRIFPELHDREVVTVANETAFVAKLCRRNLFAVFAKDVRTTDRLGRLVVEQARRDGPPAGLAAIDRLRADCQTVVLFGLRLGNRAWISQESGLVELARDIAARHEGVGFILDGMSDGTSMGWTHRLMSLSDEQAMAERIAAAIGRFAPCLSTVGATMAESLTGCAACDFFVAPAGSGMAKYKWIANKPGILISNATVLDRTSQAGGAVRVFEKFREHARPSVFLDPADVVDVPAARRNEPPHANFELDRAALRTLVDAMLVDVAPAAAPARR